MELHYLEVLYIEDAANHGREPGKDQKRFSAIIRTAIARPHLGLLAASPNFGNLAKR